MAVSDNGARHGLDRERMALEIRRAARPALALLGLIILSLVCLAIIFANNGVKWPWQSSYQREIAVDNAKGIVPQKQTVRLAGVNVGRIEDLKLHNGQPVVTISIDPKYGPLYNNAIIRLRPETPLDDMYIDIVSRGTPSAGQLGANQILPAARTQVPVDISSVLDVFNADTRARVKASIDSLGQGLGPEGPAFRQALVDLAPLLAAARQITQATAVRQTQTARLIHNFGLLTQELGSRDTQLRQLVASGASTLGELGAHESNLRATIAQLPPTMTELQSAFGALTQATNHLNPAFDALQPVAAALPSGLAALGRFGTAAEPALSKLQAPLPRLNDLMTSLAPTARGLKDSFTALTPLPPQLDNVTKLVVPCEAALAKFFENTDSLGKFSSNLSVILRGETVVGASSSGQDIPDQVQPTSCVPGGSS